MSKVGTTQPKFLKQLMAEAEVRAIIRTREDGDRKLFVVIPSNCTCEWSGLSRVSIMMPENVKRNEISGMWAIVFVYGTGTCFASYKTVHTTKLCYIDNRRAQSQKAESGDGTRHPTAALKFVV
jgi:hypothetical protein